MWDPRLDCKNRENRLKRKACDHFNNRKKHEKQQ